MSGSLVAFRSPDPRVAAASRARVATLAVEQRALDAIAERRRQLTALGEQVADELSLLSLDELEARLRALTEGARLRAITQPADRGATAAAGVAGEGGAARCAVAPLPPVPPPLHVLLS